MQFDTHDLLRALSMRVLVVDKDGQVVASVPTESPGLDLAWLAPHLERREPMRLDAPLPEAGWMHYRSTPIEDGQSAVALLPSSGLNQSFLVRLLRPLLWRVGRDGRIIEVTEELARWLGATVDAMIATAVEDWLPVPTASDRFEGEFRTLGLGMRRAVVHRTKPDILGGGWIDLICDVTDQHNNRTRLAEEMERMKALAHTDPLTGLPNRRAFENAYETVCHSREPFGLAIIDVDDMKRINDTYGHPIGDRALIEIGSALRRTVRDTDLVARIGGDEFAVLLPQANQSTADRIGPRLRDCLAIHIDAAGVIEASMGLVHSVACGEEARKLADLALYSDKLRRQSGRSLS